MRMPLNFLLLCPVLFALSGAAQDVGAPGMPNVDLETPSGQKLAAEKATIRKFFVLLYLAVLLPVVENQGEVFREKDLYPLILAAFPEQELKECPQKLQKLMNARVQALKEAADGKRDLQSEPFNPEDPEVLAFLAEYGMEDMCRQALNWMEREVNARGNMDQDSFAQAFKQFRDHVRSGASSCRRRWRNKSGSCSAPAFFRKKGQACCGGCPESTASGVWAAVREGP